VCWRAEVDPSCLKWEKVLGKMGFVLSNISLSRHPLSGRLWGLPATNCIFPEGVCLTSAPWRAWLRRVLKPNIYIANLRAPWKWPHEHCF
jgi:hypothetical protein